MRTGRNDLRSLVASLVHDREGPTQAVSSKDLAISLNRSHSQICQVLRTLAVQEKIQYYTGKQSLDRSVRLYYSSVGHPQEDEALTNRPNCGACQWLSPIQRCTLLDLAFKSNPSLMPTHLKLRVSLQAIPRDAPKCEFFDRRVPGQLKSRTMARFIRENKDGEFFRCPIDRCRQVIGAFSFYLQNIRIGSTTFYCPHCGSPMEFGYDEHFDDYRVYYWDSHFDILQKSFYDLTGETLPSQNKDSLDSLEKYWYGISIIKPGSFTLRTKDENLFVGSKTTPEELVHSTDLTYFPLRKLKYIFTKHWDDYHYLENQLHKIDPATGLKLYHKIRLYPPIDTIESVEPHDKEVGGNELLIASSILNIPTFQANLRTRVTLIETKIREFVDADLKIYFIDALNNMKDTIRNYWSVPSLHFKQWQRYEGGVSSLMVEPLKREAQKYGFLTPARSASRMVRFERFLPFAYFYARSAYDSLINGVNLIITSYLKKEIYNVISLAWDGFRGWCHRGYSFGLYLDTIEQAKIIALLWIHEAIRNEEIRPGDFLVHRGKRYDPYYCVEPNSDVHALIRKIGLRALNTTISLTSGQKMNLKQAYESYLQQQKELVNKLANHSVELTGREQSTNSKLLTLWKKLQQTKRIDVLTQKERQQIQTFSQRFFSEDFVFKPLSIDEVN